MAAADPNGPEYVPDQFAGELGWSIDHARRRMDEALALSRKLPQVVQAMEHGRLDLYKASLFAEHTTALDHDKTVEVVDAVLRRDVERRNPTSVGQMLRHAVARLDLGGCERRHQQARANRCVLLYPQDDGMTQLRAFLPADAAMAVHQRLDEIAQAPRAPGDDRTLDARRADALVDLVLRDDVTPQPAKGFRPLIQVTVASTTLAGLDDKPAHLLGHGPVPASFARHLATDPTGRWRTLALDPNDGRLVGIGRTLYRPPRTLAEFVRVRDRSCRFYDCHRSARYADLDHTIPWPKGPTTADNLGATCRRHHRMKTREIVRVEQRDGVFYWTMRDGRRYAVPPENHDPR